MTEILKKGSTDWLVIDGPYSSSVLRLATPLEIRLWQALESIADDPAARVLDVPMGTRFARIAQRALGRV